ncbi:DUF6702 family protein [Aureivirga sp. CE67]|uniref:DUF6702 family protein n=1 Tax=Aureivirga sp. CE67 TaxID=1788983 RepID=UPI0018C9FF92|nr:DUF6702 family protein [Aureivirga sp. CE67]
MNKIKNIGLLILVIFSLSSFAFHKYYIALTEIDYNSKTKSFEIISRAFIDDLELSLENIHKKEVELATPEEVENAEDLMKQYLTENIEIIVNGKKQDFIFIGKKYDADLVFFFLEIPFKDEIKSFEIKNTAIMETYPEQRNIIKLKINGIDKTFHLTKNEAKGLLNF